MRSGDPEDTMGRKIVVHGKGGLLEGGKGSLGTVRETQKTQRGEDKEKPPQKNGRPGLVSTKGQKIVFRYGWQNHGVNPKSKRGNNTGSGGWQESISKSDHGGNWEKSTLDPQIKREKDHNEKASAKDSFAEKVQCHCAGFMSCMSKIKLH